VVQVEEAAQELLEHQGLRFIRYIRNKWNCRFIRFITSIGYKWYQWWCIHKPT
jgi:hypothetical protein